GWRGRERWVPGRRALVARVPRRGPSECEAATFSYRKSVPPTTWTWERQDGGMIESSANWWTSFGNGSRAPRSSSRGLRRRTSGFGKTSWTRDAPPRMPTSRPWLPRPPRTANLRGDGDAVRRKWKPFTGSFGRRR
ncbi:unnamed protein product, partial [Ectocarpus sp. 12 AP-2014]